MKINEGNIFESMRLVLPEHREMMERMKRQMQIHKAPNSTDDELQEMQYTLQEALEMKQQIRVTVYNLIENRVYEGTPTVKGNILYLSDEFGTLPLSMKEIIGIEII